jgi:hypothetical protein
MKQKLLASRATAKRKNKTVSKMPTSASSSSVPESIVHSSSSTTTTTASTATSSASSSSKPKEKPAKLDKSKRNDSQHGGGQVDQRLHEISAQVDKQVKQDLTNFTVTHSLLIHFSKI